LSPVNFLHDHSTESDSPVLKLADTHSSVSKMCSLSSSGHTWGRAVVAI
jgi:hypothetical protein